MKRTRTLLALVVSMLALGASARNTHAMPAFFNKVDKAEMEAWVNATLQTMTPEERIAQIIIMAVNPRDDDTTRAIVKRYVADNHVGGLIYNESTLHEQVTITNYAQSLSRIPLILTMDAEWGLAMRVEGMPKYPRNLTLGAVSDEKLLYNYGREMARECRRLGLHVNYAPVLDVNDNPLNPVIGTRSFGESPEIVASHGIAYARGLEDGGVLAVGKHFPGHGSSTEDSHKVLPTINKKMEELNTCELVPFRRFIDAGFSGILTAHLYVPAIDKTEGPTTLSPRCVNDLLKNQLNFNGLIITDALDMKGATQLLKGSVCVNALLAGNDILLMPYNLEREIAAIKDAIARGTLKQADIDERCRKMLRYKYVLGLTTPQQVDPRHLEEDLKSRAEVLYRQLTAGSITVIKNKDKMLPVHNLQSRHIAVVTMGDERGLKSMFHDRCDDYAEVTPFNWKLGDDVEALCQRINGGHFNVVIVEAYGNDASVRAAAEQLSKKCKNIVLAVLCKPYEINNYGGAILSKNTKAVVLTYETTAVAQDYAVQTIFGGNAAQGRLPISLSFDGKKKRYEAGFGIHYDACRLGYTIPAEVGINNRLLSQIDSVARLGVQEHAFPGCQVVVGRHGKIVCKRAYGETDYGSGVAVNDNTLYGLASVSKATGTLSAVMKVFDDGKFRLDDKASKFIPGLRDGDKNDITFRELLYHETGMPPSLSMWLMMMDKDSYNGQLIAGAPDDNHTIKIMDGAYGHKDARLRTDILSTRQTDEFNIAIADGLWGGRVTYDSIMQRIYHADLGDKRYLYSCLNFSLLADAVQRISHAPLNYFVNSYIFAPLGAYHTLYRPLSKFSRDQIAYTEVDTYLRRQHIHGYVHDELAAFSGGVQGNAGLFSNANDLAKLFQMWLNGGTYGGVRFFKPSTVDVFTTQKSPNSHRGLGFDKPVVGNPKASNTCDEATAETYGHTGFTGTCFWVDPKNDMFYIFLSNRVSPSRNNPAFTRISARSHIQSLIYKNIEK
ncbi:MAG: serine hydrolase [Muribaculaceae bacterium]|nr:serine hydrolase [Muribaculaceae bacterium]